MVAGDHDDSDTRVPALGDGVRNGRSRRIDQRHHAEETKIFRRKVWRIRLEVELGSELYMRATRMEGEEERERERE